MHCCGLIKPLKSITAEHSCQEMLKSFSFSPWCTSHELEEDGEVDGGDRAVSGCLQLSPSSDVLSSTPKSHLNLHLQNYPSSRTLPWPALAPASCTGPAVPVGMGIWDTGLDGITQWSRSDFLGKKGGLSAAEQTAS